MIINAQVNQADVPRLKTGESVEVTIEAVTGLIINGEVERISPQATIKNNIKGYPARVVLRNVDPRVRPGMTANVKIPVASADNVAAVPLAAVFTEKNPDTQQTERFVYVVKGDSFEKRNVKVGISDYFFAEIQEGLAAGETVSLEMPKEDREKAKQLIAQHLENIPAPPTPAALARTTVPVGSNSPASSLKTPAPAAATPAATRVSATNSRS